MKCNTSLYSIAKYVIVVTLVSAILFLVYQLFSLMIPYVDRLRNGVMVTLVVFIVFASIKVLQEYDLTVKGYLIFIPILLLFYALELSILVALYKAMGVVVKPYSFPWGFGVAVASSVICVVEMFLCFVNHTMLRQKNLFRKSHR